MPVSASQCEAVSSPLPLKEWNPAAHPVPQPSRPRARIAVTPVRTGPSPTRIGPEPSISVT